MNKPRYNDCELCKWEFEKKKPEHYAGERFDDKWEYSGEYREPAFRDHFVTKDGKTCRESIVEFRKKHGTKRWILQPIGTHAKWLKSLGTKLPEPQTTVTWWANRYSDNLPDKYDNYTIHHGNIGVGTYSFSGTPDIDRIIAETLDNGALAVKVECTENISLKGEQTGNGGYVFKECLKPYIPSWHFKNYLCYYFFDSDNHIEQAITSYLEQQEQEIQVGDVVFLERLSTSEGESEKIKKIGIVVGGLMTQSITVNIDGEDKCCDRKHIRKATPDEVFEYFTVEVDGNRYVAYEGEVGCFGTTLFITPKHGDRGNVTCVEKNAIRVLADDFIKHHNITPIPYLWAQKLWGDKRPYPKGE